MLLLIVPVVCSKIALPVLLMRPLLAKVLCAMAVSEMGNQRVALSVAGGVIDKERVHHRAAGAYTATQRSRVAQEPRALNLQGIAV